MEKLRPFASGINNGSFGLQNFAYNNNVLTENIFHHLSLTNYKGIVVSSNLIVDYFKVLWYVIIIFYKYFILTFCK